MAKSHHAHISTIIKDKNSRLAEKRFDVRLFTGFAASAVAILTLAEFFVKLSIGTRPSLDNSQSLITFMTHAATPTLIVVILDTLLMTSLITFFASFRQIIVRKRPDLSWITDIAFGAGLVFVAITLVGDSMDAGTALDTVSAIPNASVIRALTEGHMLLFGPIGCILTTIITAIFAYTTFASKVIPVWTGWIAYVVALLNIIVLPTIFGGTSATSFISAGGVGVAAFATFPFLVWVVAVGIVTVRDEPGPIKHFN
jgi:hypothetical protein